MSDAIVDVAWIAAHIDDPRVRIVEVGVRRAAYDQGHIPGAVLWNTEGARRSGHVAGAVSVPIDLMRTESGAWKAPGDLQRVFDDAGVTRDRTVITYCTIGNRAGQAWFALKYLLGYPSVQVYFGPWVDWWKAPDTAIES
jgi:thiosulfate/3-mercaptopyruvate sulfurtransferase